MEYQIIEAKSYKELEEQVRFHLYQRWKPQGGVGVGVNSQSYSWYYYQAMIREDENR